MDAGGGLMKGWLVHLRDDLLETNERKVLFKANGKECNIPFFFYAIFKGFQMYTERREKRPHYILNRIFFLTELIS